MGEGRDKIQSGVQRKRNGAIAVAAVTVQAKINRVLRDPKAKKTEAIADHYHQPASIYQK